MTSPATCATTTNHDIDKTDSYLGGQDVCDTPAEGCFRRRIASLVCAAATVRCGSVEQKIALSSGFRRISGTISLSVLTSTGFSDLLLIHERVRWFDGNSGRLVSRVQGSLYGHDLVSNVSLGWLDRAPVVDTPIRIHVGDTEPYRAFATPEAPSAAGSSTIAFGTLRDGRLVCDLLSLGAFVLDPVTLKINAPVPDQRKKAIWEHTLYAWAVPLLLASSGRLVLHGAAIETESGALLVVGESTRGKTSFAAEAVRRGYRLLGEDGIAIRIDLHTGFPIAYPGCLGVRLRHGPDGKPRRKVTTPLPERSRCAQPVRLGAVIALAPRTIEGAEPVVAGAALAMAALRANCFAMPEALPALYPTIASIARSVPVATVSLRDGLSFLGDEVERLVAWTRNNSAVAA